MRPRDASIRTRYRDEVQRLLDAKLPVTLEIVSGNLAIKFHTARTFLYRNPRLAKELGLATNEQSTALEYVEAAERVAKRKEKLNGYTLAAELGREHSAVYRFLRAHMSVRSLIYEATGIRIGKGEIPRNIVPKGTALHRSSS